MSANISRRNFLRLSALGTSALILPSSIAASVAPAPAKAKKAELKQKIEKAIEAIEDFESDAAVEILQSLRSPDMDADLSEKLCKASDMIDDFEYDSAVEVLKSIL